MNACCASARDGLVRLSTYRGKNGMVTFLPGLVSDSAGLVTIYNDPKSAYLQYWRGVFEHRAPLSIPAVEAPAGIELKCGNWTPLVSDELLDALTHAYKQAIGQTTRNPQG